MDPLASSPVELFQIYVYGAALRQPRGERFGVRAQLRRELVGPAHANGGECVAAHLLACWMQEEQGYVIMRDDALQVRRDCCGERRDVARRHGIRQFEQRAQVFAFCLQLAVLHRRLLGTGANRHLRPTS